MLINIRICKFCGSNSHHILVGISEKNKTATWRCSPCKSEAEYPLNNDELKRFDIKDDEDE